MESWLGGASAKTQVKEGDSLNHGSDSRDGEKLNDFK